MFRLLIHHTAQKSLKRLPKEHQIRIREAIDVLLTNSFLGKKLEGDYEGRYTFRVWPYRIIYTIEKKRLIIIVLAIGHRQGIYK